MSAKRRGPVDHWPQQVMQINGHGGAPCRTILRKTPFVSLPGDYKRWWLASELETSISSFKLDLVRFQELGQAAVGYVLRPKLIDTMGFLNLHLCCTSYGPADKGSGFG
jgi:hypothetical protein